MDRFQRAGFRSEAWLHSTSSRASHECDAVVTCEVPCLAGKSPSTAIGTRATAAGRRRQQVQTNKSHMRWAFNEIAHGRDSGWIAVSRLRRHCRTQAWKAGRDKPADDDALFVVSAVSMRRGWTPIVVVVAAAVERASCGCRARVAFPGANLTSGVPCSYRPDWQGTEPARRMENGRLGCFGRRETESRIRRFARSCSGARRRGCVCARDESYDRALCSGRHVDMSDVSRSPVRVQKGSKKSAVDCCGLVQRAIAVQMQSIAKASCFSDCASVRWGTTFADSDWPAAHRNKGLPAVAARQKRIAGRRLARRVGSHLPFWALRTLR